MGHDYQAQNTDVNITFNYDGSQILRTKIDTSIAKVMKRWERRTSCRRILGEVCGTCPLAYGNA